MYKVRAKGDVVSEEISTIKKQRQKNKQQQNPGTLNKDKKDALRTPQESAKPHSLQAQWCKTGIFHLRGEPLGSLLEEGCLGN